MNALTVVYWLILIGSRLSKVAMLTPPHPEIYMNVTQIIDYYGYPIENHEVTTKDGYILSLQRIPHGKIQNPEGNIGVVLLQHGFLDSSITWVNNKPSNSLGFILADAGYDVWLANSRGNIYSRKHRTLSPESRRFWDFTWDEMAKYDLPAFVNYIIDVSEAEQIGYIGHSQGNEIAFAKFGENSDLNSKIFALVALAPVAFYGHIMEPYRSFFNLSYPVNTAAQKFKHGELSYNKTKLDVVITYMCSKASNEKQCLSTFFDVLKFDSNYLNQSRIPIYTAHMPAGSSSKNFLHYGQAMRSKKFQKFDHGKGGNFRHYHHRKPPQYNLVIKDIPIALFFGGVDMSTTAEDVDMLIKELGPIVALKRNVTYYDQFDLIWANNAKDVVFNEIIAFLRINAWPNL